VSDWAWVTLAYAVVYGTLISYGVSVGLRTRDARRTLDSP
jgi:hypothetical protein